VLSYGTKVDQGDEMKNILVVVSALMLVIFSGCDSSKTASDAQPETAVDTQSEATVESKTETATSADLTGFAATKESWDQNHEEASGFQSGSAYLPNVSISEGSRLREQPKYAAVSEVNGLITNYTIYFSEGTGVDAAKAEVLKEFPQGAKEISAAPKGRCLMTEVSSDPVQKVLQASNHIIVSYYSGSGDYSPGSVRYAILSSSSKPAAEKSC